MRRYYLQSGLWMSVLTLLILGGLYVAADLNATAKLSNTLNIDGGFWSDIGTGFASDKDAARRAKIAAQNSFSLSLDANSAAGDQAVTSVNTSADQVVAIQVFGSSIQNASGFGLRFEYDASQVTYQGFDVGSVLPGSPQVLAEHGTNPTFVTIGIASFGGQATVSSGLVGTVRFLTTTGFSGTAVQLVRAELSRSGQSETVTLTTRVELQVSTAPSPDFDGDGTVGISDFLQFVNHFGTSRGDAGYDAKYDLDGNDVIGISDFLIFANNFGSQVPPSGGGGGGAIVTIADANLRAVIADSLGKARNASITRAEMATLTRIDAPNKGIRSLTGLEHATNLQTLELGYVWVNNELVNSNDISNLSPLSNLTNLTRLDLWYNSISDISALSNLTNLTWLYLSQNSISDISALSNLTNLRILGLSGNSISDISALSNLTNLTWLYLSRNIISDISALSNLTNLETLGLDGNSISDISVLSNLTNLEILDLSGNSISDISALSNLTNLENLGLDGNSISDISALSNLTNLEFLNLSENSISDISVLSNLTNLEILYLWYNSISDISALSNLTNLRILGLNENSISDISPLVANTGLGSGDTVGLKSNPLSSTSINTHIPTLQRIGVTVEFGSSSSSGGGGGGGGSGSGGGDSGGACTAGLVVNPGGSCTYKGFTFSVSSSGTGSISFFSAGNSIDARGSTINGVRWNFYASRNSGSNSWTIHTAN